MLRRGFAVATICALDAVALVFLQPHFAQLGRRLGEAHRWLGQSGPDAVLADLATAGLWLVAAWLGVGAAATLLARLPGALGRAAALASRRLLPAALHRLVAGSVGVGIVLAPVSAAAASPTVAPGQPAAAAAARLPAAAAAARQPGAGGRLPAPVWPVNLPSGHSPARPRPAPIAPSRTQPPAATQPVRVRAGDSLWLIAARRLGASADPSQVAATWPRWYRANRAVVGDDPNLIMPGQLLTPPAGNSNETQR